MCWACTCRKAGAHSQCRAFVCLAWKGLSAMVTNVCLTAFPHKPIMFRGEVRLNVEEKKTRAARERETRGGGDERRDLRRNERGPGGPRGIVGGGMMRDRDGRGPPPRGGMAQKLGSGRGTGQMEGRFTGQRR